MNNYENQKEKTITQEIPNAFATAASATAFSLPRNLNNRLVMNKQKLQEQHKNDDVKINSDQAKVTHASRPKLSILKQENSLMNLKSEEMDYSNLVSVKLPPFTVKFESSSAIWQEIKLISTAAIILYLGCASYLTFQIDPMNIHSLFLPTWTFGLVWFTFGGADAIHSLKFFQASGIIMLVITGWSYKTILLPQLLGCLLFFISERISFKYRQLETEISKQLDLQQTTVQKIFDHTLHESLSTKVALLSTLSKEVKEATSTIVATLEQFSPSSILVNAHELLSACSIAVPIASISAINTTIKETSYISSHLNLISQMLKQPNAPGNLITENKIKSNIDQEFDAGELIQTVGDALAGVFAKLGVHLVTYHTDNVLYYPNVLGDEDAIKYTLINLLRNTLEGCTPGACVELGLAITPISDSSKLKVIFDIVQTASPAIPIGLSSVSIPNTTFTSKFLDYVGGKIEFEDLGRNRARAEVSLELNPGSNSDQKILFIEKPSQILEKQLENIRFSNEPTLKELSSFINQLKGVKLILYAPEKSMFAKHLTSCLTSWNTDISHLPVLVYSEDEENASDTGTTLGSDSDSVSSQQIKTPLETRPQLPPTASRSINGNSSNNKVPSPAIEEDHIHSIPPAFVLIDDDVLTLEKKLREIYDKPIVAPTMLDQQQYQQHQRRHRRAKSRTHVSDNGSLHGTVAIIFFTSLTNYKRVRDTIHWFSSVKQSPYLPRVVVVPKPAGPRRFLTALHSAWMNAVVEPQFIPIATSPFSPFIGTHHSSGLSLDSNLINNVLVTPGGVFSGGPLMTPHDTNLRFSPGRRPNNANNGPPSSRIGALSSPSGLQIESEKGNYFFDPMRPSMNNANVITPSKLNVSPHLAAVNNPILANPIAMTLNKPSNPSIITSGVGVDNNCKNTPVTASSGSLVNNNSSPNDIKRRLRSHSQSFMTPGRRTIIDLSVSSVNDGSSADQIANTNNSEIVQTKGILNANSRNALNNMEEGTKLPQGEIISLSSTNKVLSSPQLEIESSSPPKTTTFEALKVNTLINSPSSIIDAKKPQTPIDPVVPKPKPKFNFKISNRKRKEKADSFDKPSPPITVLIVEDNVINQAILSTWMKKHNIKFSVASDGQEAVEKWKGGGFHLILMDIQLPVMDGIAATKAIRAIEKERQIGVLPSNIGSIEKEDKDINKKDSSTTSEEKEWKESQEEEKNLNSKSKTSIKKKIIPSPSNSSSSNSNSSTFQSPVIIVALTASSLDSDRQAALAAGCNDFLTKPVSLEWLGKKIMEWGCMQALIDFEGWRKWKRSADGTTVKSPNLKKSISLSLKSKKISPNNTNNNSNLIASKEKEDDAREKELLAMRTEEMFKDESRAIILVGTNKRKPNSNMVDDRSNSRKNTPSQPVSKSASPTKTSFHHQLCKKASDPDLHHLELSIPKQVEAREQKRLSSKSMMLDWDEDEDDLEDEDEL